MAQGKTIWLEKSPDHLRYIDQIEKLVDEAKFIHILRNGFDNIASIYDLAGKYPETWGLGIIRSISAFKIGLKMLI